MESVREINAAGELAELEGNWRRLLDQTHGASFFHSPAWLDVYWRHSGAGQKLRVLVVLRSGEPTGILPLVVRSEKTKVGRLRLLTYPLDAWGSFYGPIGPDPAATLRAGLKHIRRRERDWDVLEPRWLGAPGTVPGDTGRALRAAGFQAIPSVFDRTAILEFRGRWEEHLARQPRRWRRNLRADVRKLTRLWGADFVRYRPAGRARGEEDPRWDLYDACEEVARRSWQGRSTTGTTLSHESVRPLLRELHVAAAAEGAVDLNLLLLDGEPAAFVYNYHYRGRLYGLRMGYDAERCPAGAGNALLSWVIRDSFSRGDCLYDLGVGSLDWKRNFAARIVPILRYSHCHPTAPRAQLLRLKRWMDSRSMAPCEVLDCGIDLPAAGETAPV
jgi:CelD/BcsL family acetyltransferase involved in cellulose biosynthesis